MPGPHAGVCPTSCGGTGVPSVPGRVSSSLEMAMAHMAQAQKRYDPPYNAVPHTSPLQSSTQRTRDRGHGAVRTVALAPRDALRMRPCGPPCGQYPTADLSREVPGTGPGRRRHHRPGAPGAAHAGAAGGGGAAVRHPGRRRHRHQCGARRRPRGRSVRGRYSRAAPPCLARPAAHVRTYHFVADAVSDSGLPHCCRSVPQRTSQTLWHSLPL